jgi:hypothetical protein
MFADLLGVAAVIERRRPPAASQFLALPKYQTSCLPQRPEQWLGRLAFLLPKG